MSDMSLTVPKLPDEAFPYFVSTPEQRERWELAVAIAESISAQNEEHGAPNALMVFHLARSAYFSEMPTGSTADPAPPPLEEAELDDAGDPDEVLWARLEQAKPPADAPDDVQVAHIGRVADFLDALFGNPDDLPVADSIEDAPEPGDGLTNLYEALALHLPYKPDLHPRDRMGKWSAKLNGIRKAARDHHTALRQHIAGAVAGAALRADTQRSSMRGGALAGDVSKAHDRNTEWADRLRHHAQEERNRSGIRGARQQAVKAHAVTHGAALKAMASVYSEEAERKLGPFHENVNDAAAAFESWDRAQTLAEARGVTAEKSHEVARYAMEHRDEIRAVAHGLKHLAHGYARAKGIAAADDELEDVDAASVLSEALEPAEADDELELSDLAAEFALAAVSADAADD